MMCTGTDLLTGPMPICGPQFEEQCLGAPTYSGTWRESEIDAVGADVGGAAPVNRLVLWLVLLLGAPELCCLALRGRRQCLRVLHVDVLSHFARHICLYICFLQHLFQNLSQCSTTRFTDINLFYMYVVEHHYVEYDLHIGINPIFILHTNLPFVVTIQDWMNHYN
jgi:hypothetical protein